MVGTGGPVGPPPPVVIVPAPLKLSEVAGTSDNVPVRVGKEPTAPAYVPVPPVTVAEPARGPVSDEESTVSVPVMVPPLARVIVYGPLMVAPSERVPLMVPFPMPPVKLA